MLTYDGIEFDESAHTYTLNGRVYPSVTQVLKSAGMIDVSGPWFTEFARTRGQYVHLACEMHDMGTLDESELDPQIKPYLDAWNQFLVDSRAEIIHVEQRFVDEVRGYSGTRDRVAMMRGEQTIIDIKTWPRMDWHGIQTAAYSFGQPVSRCSVHLNEKGKYHLHMHDRKDDWATWLSALTIHHWKEKNAK